MKKIILAALTLISLNLSAQNKNIRSISSEDLKELNVLYLTNNEILDESSSILSASVKDGALIKQTLIKAEIDGKEFTFTRLDNSHMEIYKAEGASYVKHNDQVYRFRLDNSKEGALFYLDELKDSGFEKTEKPIFRASSENYGKYSHVVPGYSKESFIFTSSDGGSEVYAEDVTGKQVYTIDEYDMTSSKVKNHFKFDFDKKEKFLLRSYDIIGNNFLSSFIYLKDDLWNIRIFNYDGNSVKAIELPVKNARYISSVNIINRNGSVILNTLYRDSEFEWSTAIYSMDLTSNKATLLNELPISHEVIARDYGDDGFAKSLLKRSFSPADVVVDTNGDIYISHVAYRTEGELLYLHKISNWMISGDILITKISGDQVVWNQLVKRCMKTGKVFRIKPELLLSEDKLVFYDQECSDSFSAEGKYIAGNKMRIAGGKVKKAKITIDKESSSITRELVNE